MVRTDGWGGGGLQCGLLFLCAGDVDDVVGDHAEPNPAPHSIIAFVTAAIETVPSLGDADASLASGAPLLAVAEPALPLLTLALGTLGRAIRNADAFDAPSFASSLV